MVGLLIAYLPTMYSAFSRREQAVNMLEVRAGNPPNPYDMLSRFHRIHGLDKLAELWKNWEIWFADVEESHTTLPALVFFRSPLPEHSWVTAAGTVLGTHLDPVAWQSFPAGTTADLWGVAWLQAHPAAPVLAVGDEVVLRRDPGDGQWRPLINGVQPEEPVEDTEDAEPEPEGGAMWAMLIGGYGWVVAWLIPGLDGAPRRWAILPEKWDFWTQLSIPFIVIMTVGILVGLYNYVRTATNSPWACLRPASSAPAL